MVYSVLSYFTPLLNTGRVYFSLAGFWFSAIVYLYFLLVLSQL